ncbi:hypothetical protein LEMLEM_LOCUS14193 [Lemmus lemmus]
MGSQDTRPKDRKEEWKRERMSGREPPSHAGIQVPDLCRSHMRASSCMTSTGATCGHPAARPPPEPRAGILRPLYEEVRPLHGRLSILTEQGWAAERTRKTRASPRLFSNLDFDVPHSSPVTHRPSAERSQCPPWLRVSGRYLLFLGCERSSKSRLNQIETLGTRGEAGSGNPTTCTCLIYASSCISEYGPTQGSCSQPQLRLPRRKTRPEH